jgi:hypothetical protein
MRHACVLIVVLLAATLLLVDAAAKSEFASITSSFACLPTWTSYDYLTKYPQEVVDACVKAFFTADRTYTQDEAEAECEIWGAHLLTTAVAGVITSSDSMYVVSYLLAQDIKRTWRRP